MGARFKTPMPLLWQHRHDQPVGHVTFAQPTKKGIPFRAELPLVKEPGTLKDRIDEAVQSIRYGLVAAVSIGFSAVEGMVERIDTGLRYKQWEWLELSLVTIPANAEAVITAVKSVDQASMAASTPRQISVSPGVSGVQKPARKKGAVTLIERTYS
jgi:HK97 family phage prohead protease